MSDQVDQSRSPNTDDLGDLYRRYAAWLRSQLRRRFGDEADDIVQETYLRIAPWQAKGRIRHPRALLVTVANNIGKNHARHAAYGQNYATEANDIAPPLEGGQFDGLLLKQVVVSLPEPERTVFILSRIRGLTYLQIAAHLDIPVKTVEWRMSRALNHCAAHLRS